MRSVGRLLCFVWCLAAAFPVAALAHAPTTIAPPGDSAITQYVENVPTAQGPTPTHQSAGGPIGPLTAAPARRLDRLGRDGRQLAQIVAVTAPSSAGATPSPASHRGDGKSAAGVGPTGPPGDSAASAGSGGLPLSLSPAAVRSPESLLADAATGGGGLGFLLPGIMLASVAGAVLVRLRSRRRTR